MSKKELDRLGDRLRDAPVPSEEDLRALESVRPHYLAALAAVRGVLVDELGLAVTHREKNRDTIIEKLRRERDMRLSRTQDVVGSRVVRDMTLAEQDDLAAQITARFPEHLLRDRRATPSHGYRAIHIIAKMDGLPVEIQLRTTMQHAWAQGMERMGDQWGRDIRYGGQVPQRDRLLSILPGGVQKSRSAWVEVLKGLSSCVAKVELGHAPVDAVFTVQDVPGAYTIGELLDFFRLAPL